jgi:2-C-methyl-D-erythritol 2,4-cyclodiphosphate synthase
VTNRVGIGLDVHAFDESRPLILGGVTIEGQRGLAGHSDADVVCHAVIDALLGAAALGDLGRHFPGDARWKDASSIEMLTEAVRLLADAGWAPNNVDITIVAQTPRLAPHGASIATTLARAMEMETGNVSVKSTTTDGLGFVGRNEGLAALAVATVRPLT